MLSRIEILETVRTQRVAKASPQLVCGGRSQILEVGRRLKLPASLLVCLSYVLGTSPGDANRVKFVKRIE